MALVVQIDNTTQTKDALLVQLLDPTGAYDGTTNLGGYGTPNPAYTDIVQSLIRVVQPKQTTSVDFTLNNSSLPTAQDFANPSLSTPFDLNSYLLGNTDASNIEALVNGSYQVFYYVFFTGSTVGATLNSKTVTGTGLTTLLADTDILLIGGVLCRVDKTTGFTPTSIQLTTEFTGATGSYAALLGYEAVGQFLLIQQAKNRVQCAIAKRDACCGCGGKNITRQLQLSVEGARAKATCADYQGAQEIVDVLEKDLQFLNPCGC